MQWKHLSLSPTSRRTTRIRQRRAAVIRMSGQFAAWMTAQRGGGQPLPRYRVRPRRLVPPQPMPSLFHGVVQATAARITVQNRWIIDIQWPS